MCLFFLVFVLFCLFGFPSLQLSLLQFIVKEIEFFWAAEKVTKNETIKGFVTKSAYLMNNVLRHLVLGENDFSMPSR